jgi:hypothetical protein
MDTHEIFRAASAAHIERLETINAKLLAALKGTPKPTWNSPMSTFEERYDIWYAQAQAAIEEATS